MKGQANPAANSGANPAANSGANPEAWVHRGHWQTGCRLRAATPPLWEQTSEAWGSKNKLDPEDEAMVEMAMVMKMVMVTMMDQKSEGP